MIRFPSTQRKQTDCEEGKERFVVQTQRKHWYLTPTGHLPNIEFEVLGYPIHWHMAWYAVGFWVARAQHPINPHSRSTTHLRNSTYTDITHWSVTAMHVGKVALVRHMGMFVICPFHENCYSGDSDFEDPSNDTPSPGPHFTDMA